MSDVSSSRRKLGLAAIAGTALVTLPLTASVTYAQPETPEAPEAPEAPQRIVRVERQPGGDEAPNERRVIIRRNGDQQTVEAEGVDEAEMAEVMAELREMDVEIDAEVAEALAEARAGMVEARSEMAEHRAEMARNRVAMAENRARMPRMETRCDGDQTVQHRTDAQGRQVMVICRRAVQASAVQGLREAQRTIRDTPGMPADQRERIVDELQEQIDRMEREEVSYQVTPPAAPLAPSAVGKPGIAAVPVTRVVYGQSGWMIGVTSTKATSVSQSTVPQPVKLVPVRVQVDGTVLFDGPPIAS